MGKGKRIDSSQKASFKCLKHLKRCSVSTTVRNTVQNCGKRAVPISCPLLFAQGEVPCRAVLRRIGETLAEGNSKRYNLWGDHLAKSITTAVYTPFHSGIHSQKQVLLACGHLGEWQSTRIIPAVLFMTIENRKQPKFPSKDAIKVEYR